MRIRRLAAPLLVAAVTTGCVSHPVSPARTYAKYEGKAVTTAKSALSSVQTARLAVVAAVKHHAFGPYLSNVIGEAEGGVSAVSGTFASIQPPDGRADRLRDELDDLLSQAEDHVAQLRIAVRRGRIGGLAPVAAPLAEDVEKLQAFIQEHRA